TKSPNWRRSGAKNERGGEPTTARRRAGHHGRGHPRPRRPGHPPLRVADPQPDRAADRALPGPEPSPPRRRTAERPAAETHRQQRRATPHARDRALAMKRLAPGVWRVKEVPYPSINVYLAENVLIDAGRKWDKKRIFGDLEGVEIAEVALTH